ncbi:MAG TPA: NAD(P)/FAD-dependent oxidoreductase [Albidovulum sp.]|uniref:phytoene desaturase family protein n=1 Tax=Albidovulum sp. TaxID=1872424 RepID=UPI002C655963|nr:NAD(P)/FAD-dependent oxidoreductase [Albidovulum sp.]
MPSLDCIVIGGGTNGLACAARLARKGRRVLVLEASGTPGGGAAGGEFAPGFRSPGLAHIVHMIDPRVADILALDRHGLRYHTTSLASSALAATGDHLRLDGAFGASLTGTIGAEDRAAWADLRARLMRFAAALAPFRGLTPPRLARASGNDWAQLARLGLGVRRMGKTDFREFLRMFLINVWDVLNDELSDERLKGLVAFDATLGSWLGPRSPNSLLLLLNRLSGEVAGQQGALALPKGGMPAVAAALASAAEAAGVRIRTSAAVARIDVVGDCVIGVTLANGEELRAPRVVSAISPKTTLLSLLGPRHLDTGAMMRIRHQKSRGGAAKLHLALSALPDFMGADPKTRLVIAPGADHVERAFNPVKYGEVPTAPVMEVVIPSAFEPGLAPDGLHVLSAVVQYAPHAPKAGEDAARAAMLEATLATLESHAPGIRKLIVGQEMLMPYDIERRYGMPGGNWHHGELSAEQMLFLRPAPGMAQYASPVPGLWLASAGTHPGGGISGASGWNAAGRILQEVRA